MLSSFWSSYDHRIELSYDWIIDTKLGDAVYTTLP